VDTPQTLGLFALCLGLMMLTLCGTLRDRGGKQNLFLHRLSLSPRAIFWNHGAYNSLCFLLLFGMEAMSLLGLAFWNSRLFPEAYNHQGLMLECYRCELLHSFLPLSDWLGWVVLGVLILGLGLSAAVMPHANRRGKRSVLPLLTVGVTVLYGHLQMSMYAVSPDGKAIGLTLGLIFLIPGILRGCVREEAEDG